MNLDRMNVRFAFQVIFNRNQTGQNMPECSDRSRVEENAVQTKYQIFGGRKTPFEILTGNSFVILKNRTAASRQFQGAQDDFDKHCCDREPDNT
jgi:hypothetical protein